MTGERRTRSTEAFFGRRRGKALKSAASGAAGAAVAALEDRSDEACARSLASLFGHAPERIVLEIGFGGGEHLLHRAKEAAANRFHRRRALRQFHGEIPRGGGRGGRDQCPPV
jgi:tRNA (guanine-N7-)-methyltransferase